MDKNICRTCLLSSEEMRNVFTEIRITGKEVRLADVLDSYFNYQVDPEDGLPKDICISCVYQLTNIYTFDFVIKRALEKLSNFEGNTEKLTKRVEINNSFDDQDLFEDAELQADIDIKQELHQEDLLLNTEDTDPTLHFYGKPLFCTECGEKFKTQQDLYQHTVQEHATESKVGRDCDLCNQTYEDFRSLIIHRKLHFSPYVCSRCWNGFSTKYKVKHHLCQKEVEKSVKKEPEKVMKQCDQCGKSYPANYIKMHMLIHEEQRPYACKYCPKRFKVPCGLNSHIQWNHKRSKDHKCEQCGALFVTASARSSHYRKKHLNEKKFMCDNCGKKFFSRSEFKRHMLTHTGVKNFHCQFCEKSYQTRYGLNVHLKSHSIQGHSVL